MELKQKMVILINYLKALTRSTKCESLAKRERGGLKMAKEKFVRNKCNTNISKEKVPFTFS